MDKMPRSSCDVTNIPHLCGKPAFLSPPSPCSSFSPQSSAPNNNPGFNFLTLPIYFPPAISLFLSLVCHQPCILPPIWQLMTSCHSCPSWNLRSTHLHLFCTSEFPAWGLVCGATEANTQGDLLGWWKWSIPWLSWWLCKYMWLLKFVGWYTYNVCSVMFIHCTQSPMLNKEGSRALNPHIVSKCALGTEVGLDYPEDAEIKNALSRNKAVKWESLSPYDSQALW